MINFEKIEEDVIEKILHSIRLKDNKYNVILNIRLTCKKTRNYINNLFSELEATIITYCYNWIPETCIVCMNNIKTNQSIDPLTKSPYFGLLNYCDNAYCYFNVKKSIVKICYGNKNSKIKAIINCNDVLINNNPLIPLKVKRTNGNITENIKLGFSKIKILKNKVKIYWTELANIFNHNNDLKNMQDYEIKEKIVEIEDLILLNPQLSINPDLIPNPFNNYIM